jgi:hypothetical protein
MNVLFRLKLLNVMKTCTLLTVFPTKSFTTNKSIYVEPVQGLNLNCRYISWLWYLKCRQQQQLSGKFYSVRVCITPEVQFTLLHITGSKCRSPSYMFYNCWNYFSTQDEPLLLKPVRWIIPEFIYLFIMVGYGFFKKMRALRFLEHRTSTHILTLW